MIVAAYALERVERMGPVQNKPALKKYGEILSMKWVLCWFFWLLKTYRPDFKVKLPNWSASTSTACSINSTLKFASGETAINLISFHRRLHLRFPTLLWNADIYQVNHTRLNWQIIDALLLSSIKKNDTFTPSRREEMPPWAWILRSNEPPVKLFTDTPNNVLIFY